ncbi:recombinase family protein [Rhizobium sp. LjRoot258]|uniref:recombinase family protein n=1 Tax=Rhizobium sp. LjRoot258 TaxID=3342299 RepID=UPI003ECFB410
MLPPGLCWGEAGKIEIDPDEHVVETIRLVFAKFRELGSARQVFLWLRSADIKMPVVLHNIEVCKLAWNAPAYHSVMQILHNPLYAGAYAFGRRAHGRGLLRAALERLTGYVSRGMNGAYCCVTIIPVISVGRSMRTIKSFCLRMRT